jgi:hypothetical protein
MLDTRPDPMTEEVVRDVERMERSDRSRFVRCARGERSSGDEIGRGRCSPGFRARATLGRPGGFVECALGERGAAGIGPYAHRVSIRRKADPWRAPGNASDESAADRVDERSPGEQTTKSAGM